MNTLKMSQLSTYNRVLCLKPRNRASQRWPLRTTIDARKSGFLALFFSLGVMLSLPLLAQQSPPELGQETKGKPAVDETVSSSKVEAPAAQKPAAAAESESEARIDSILGKAKVTESKRENGQLYLIELEHSSGAKQYIEETDSDGKIESTSNDIEETPNLPKWKIGSW